MRLFLFGFFSVLCIPLYAQHVLRGKVMDASAGKPLTSTAIYLPEIHRGTYTDSLGRFVVHNISAKQLLLEVSHVGFQTHFIQLRFPQDSSIQVLLQPSLIPIQEVVVTGAKSNAPEETSFNIVQLNKQEIAWTGALNVSDALARLPGVSQLTTGPGISKPVIRGLYGNRIQINVNGLRFDNQQWQDEHGLGLSDVGIERIEVIRGPASVLYGADAMGGVVNIIEDRPAFVNETVNDINARVHTNTYGLSLNYGTARATEKRWRRFRAGFDNHADYNNGNNTRILNSRFSSYNMKSSWGINKGNSIHVLNLMASLSQFGFVFDSLNRKEEDARLSRNFDGPHHAVSFAQVSNENTYYRGINKVKLNAGFISNLRLEDEGGGGISLSMLLNTINATVQVIRPTGNSGELTLGASLFGQTNTNFGGRIIIPDAITGESSIFAFYQQRAKRWLLEGGARLDGKWIETFKTASLNVAGNEGPTHEIFPFTKFYTAFNISAGAEYFLTNSFALKANASSGYRPGNLAELSSNGLHEGTLRWEIGMPNAKIEQNLNLEGSLNYHSSRFRGSVSYFRNDFHNYFYLAPDGTEYFGFQIYHFRQSEALLKGAELEFTAHPFPAPLTLKGSYAFIEAQKNDGTYLPFIPANKLFSELQWHFKSINKVVNPGFRIGSQYAFSQDRPAEFETTTPGYWIVHAGVSLQYGLVNLSLVANNLLNENYYDHLSRYKYYGISNMGRSLIITVNTKF